MDDGARFTYENVTGRPSGRFISTASRIIPGVGFVHRQIAPYARAWRAANLVALTRPGPRWIVLGDSMSQSVGATSFDAGWVNQVHERLAPDVDYAVINLAASGALVSDVLETQLPAWRSLPPRTDDDPRPDLVTVLIGSNDLLRKQHRLELPAAVNKLLNALPSGSVVATMPQPRRAAEEVNTLIERARTKQGIVVANMRSGPGSVSAWRGKLAEDHFHPNNLGYARIADVFYQAISRSAHSSEIRP
jgi:lysophospholipase L1-like esterase